MTHSQRRKKSNEHDSKLASKGYRLPDGIGDKEYMYVYKVIK